MAQNTGQFTITESRKAQKTEQATTSTPRKDQLMIQERVFKSSLENLCELLNDVSLDESILPSEELPEEEIDLDDSDLDDNDPEEEEPVIQTRQEGIDDFSVQLAGVPVAFADVAILDRQAVYILSVSPGQNGGSTCRFEPPDWFNCQLPVDIGKFVLKLDNFLKAIAIWFEVSQQKFLKNPSPQTYACGSSAISQFENPFASQIGFLANINNELSSKDAVDKTRFSNLLDKIWLIWPGWNMPLKACFTREFKFAWLVEICTEIYKELDVSTIPDQLRYPEINKENMDKLKNRDVVTLNPEEKLHLLRDRLNFGRNEAAVIFAEVQKRIEEN